MDEDDMLLREISHYREEYLDNFWLEQQDSRYIASRCVNCIHHRLISFKNKQYHICNDVWSEMNVGEHITYCETFDMCFLNNGYDPK